MKDDVEIGVLTREELLSASNGVRILDLLQRTPPGLLTGRYGNYEPLRAQLNDTSQSEIMRNWDDPFLWASRKKPRVSGRIWAGTPDSHSCLFLRLASTDHSLDEVVDLLDDFCSLFAADFGYFHCFSAEELRDSSRQEITKPFRMCVTTHDLKKGIPDLAAVTILGKSYIELLGRNQLLSAPVHEARELAPGMISLHLVEDPGVSKTDYEGFSEVRERAKDHIGREAFWGPNGEVASLIPDFGLAPNTRADEADAFWSKLLDS